MVCETLDAGEGKYLAVSPKIIQLVDILASDMKGKHFVYAEDPQVVYLIARVLKERNGFEQFTPGNGGDLVTTGRKYGHFCLYDCKS